MRRPREPSRPLAAPAAVRGRQARLGTSRRSLLVVRMRTPAWHCSASATTRLAVACRTCSQLSSTTSTSRSASAATRSAVRLLARRSGISRASATEAGTRAGSASDASSISRAPSSKPASASVATSERNSGLAAPASAGQGYYPGGAKTLKNRGYLRPAPD